jgi:excisionase family DNA binding protein
MELTGIYVTVEQAARRKGVTRAAIHRAIKEGRLPARRVGRGWLLLALDVDRYTPVYEPPKRRKKEEGR